MSMSTSERTLGRWSKILGSIKHEINVYAIALLGEEHSQGLSQALCMEMTTRTPRTQRMTRMGGIETMEG